MKTLPRSYCAYEDSTTFLLRFVTIGHVFSHALIVVEAASVFERGTSLKFLVELYIKPYPPFKHRRRFYYNQSVAENVADRDKSQEKRSGVFISASNNKAGAARVKAAIRAQYEKLGPITYVL
ncbi:hypothetical protein DPMN_134043 [Dreissena polymorpha]|uniref:Uncharacterized protein n=1 Tax=Dreissena polymorpha TaxID=45954 RepID=A0A9D4FZ28_DREPO|nr:hypothetical protein DPMN_134043 [Dreissena polymorpha]